jgi:serine/threonine-protein kinase
MNEGGRTKDERKRASFELKIADFGLARLSPAASLARTPMPGIGAVVDYVAPEQAHHPALADRRADLYSLGAVLYFVLTGRPPFAGGTVEEKLRRHLWEEPARLEPARPDVPPALAALVHQMLAKNPAYRPGSAAEVADRLTAIGHLFGDEVRLDLPAHTAPYPLAAGPLSAVHAVAPTPTPETSPWEQVTAAETVEEPEVQAGRPRRPRRCRSVGVPAWLVASLTVGSLGLCAAAVSVIVKTVAK